VTAKEVPKSVVQTDHRLEGAHDRASEELAKHRWHWTLDESNRERVKVSVYARAVGRSQSVIYRHARGWDLYARRINEGGVTPEGFTIQDAVRQAESSAERQEFNEAIAEGSGRSVGSVARGDNRVRTNEIIAHAKERAERRGTSPVDEARRIAEHQRQSRETAQRERQSKSQAHFFRWNEIEGDLIVAQRKLLHALSVAEGVDFTEEEMEFIRVAVAKTRAVLDLIDLRMAGTPDIDWDAELAKLGES
jgi:hypothetical protein